MKKILFSKWVKRAALGLLAVVVVVAAAAAGTGLVFAQSSSPTPNPPQQSSPSGLRIAVLEKAFAAENTALSTQASNLDKANQLIAKAQARIDQARANGKNVGGLLLALNAFKAQIANAQSLHDTAGLILADQVGFDANGKVTTPAAAAQTVRDAHQSLKDARQVMRQAVFDLRSVIRLCRRANSSPNSSATPAPTSSGSLN